MLKNFYKKNTRTILVIAALAIIFLVAKWINSDKTGYCLDHPAVGQVYIFNEENLYAPMLLDSIDDQQLYFRDYSFVFMDAIPKREQILDAEFDHSFFAIYDQVELNRLYKSKQLIRIYEE